MITVACVLKTGGDFTDDYVLNLAAGVRRNLTMPHQFVCLTDSKALLAGRFGFSCLPLKYELPGWWSKMELFRLPGPVLSLDLDTTIVGPVDSLVAAVNNLTPTQFMMLRAFRRERWASGIMGWNNEFLWVMRRFLDDRLVGNFIDGRAGKGLRMGPRFFRGDQDWLEATIPRNAVEIVSAQDLVAGIYSYKNHLRDQPLPDDARVVCFHGKPRPHERAGLVPWIREHWGCPA